MEDLEGRIDALYATPLARFTPERDALARALRTEGDGEAVKRVTSLRKPVVAAWALNQLSRQDPGGVGELAGLGRRLRDAQRRAMSGGDAEELRAATDERRALVSRLVVQTLSILEREGGAGASQEDDIAMTLEAAAVDEDAAEALRAGRLTRPMRPPTGFGEPSATLSVVSGGRHVGPSGPPEHEDPRARTKLLRELRRELGAAETKQRRAGEAVARAREALEQAERRRVEARDRVREAEAGQRGATLEAKRLAAALAKLEGSS